MRACNVTTASRRHLAGRVNKTEEHGGEGRGRGFRGAIRWGFWKSRGGGGIHVLLDLKDRDL